MHFKNAINLFSQRAYEIQFISSDQTQKHSAIAAAAESFLPYKFHFSYNLIYWNEIPDIRQKVIESVIKYWNHIQTFAFCYFLSENVQHRLCLSREFTIIHLLLHRYFEFHDDARFKLSIREQFLSCGSLCKYLHSKRYTRTHEILLFYRFLTTDNLFIFLCVPN